MVLKKQNCWLYTIKILKKQPKIYNHRKVHNGFKVAMAETEQIYQEFGSGRADPSAIRNFAKMIYDRYPSFRYLLLVGDGSFDYKNWCPLYPIKTLYLFTKPMSHFIPSTPSYRWLLCFAEQQWRCQSQRRARYKRVGRLTVTTAQEAMDG